jgi:hypothetical protein
MPRYRVVHFVGADRLGDNIPWIASEDEVYFEADECLVTSGGVLSLIKDDKATEMFADGCWSHVSISVVDEETLA